MIPKQASYNYSASNDDSSAIHEEGMARATDSYKVSVIIPTLNEEGNIAHLLTRLDETMVKAGIVYEAIVMDDRSTDRTRETVARVAREKFLPVQIHEKREEPGKAFSLMEGFALARYEILAMIDGDLQYPPEAFPEMIAQLAYADMVVGDRRVTYNGAGRFRSMMSNTFTSIIQIVFGLDTDMQSGMKVFRRSIYDGIETAPGKWSLDLHLITHAVSNGYKVANVPIVYGHRQTGESKVIPSLVVLELMMTVLALKLRIAARHLFGSTQKSRTRRVIKQYTVPSKASLEEEAKHYAAWLAEDTQRGYTLNAPEAMQEYADIALQTVKMANKDVTTFAPFRPKLSALQTFTRPQLFIMGAVGLLLALGLVFFPIPTLIGAIGLITIFYFSDLLVNFLMAARTLNASAAETIDDGLIHALKDADWPTYTVLCPLYKEAAVVPQFVEAMQALDYPADKLQVLFLTEQDDVETRVAIKAMGLPHHFQIVTVPNGEPRTKPRACNYGLLYTRGRYVVIYDAEDRPDPLQLKKAVLTFAHHPENVACVQAKLNFYNANQNLLTRWFTAEYSLWFDLTLPGLQQTGLPLPLGGTSNHFRTEVLRTLGAWDAFNVTEDCDLGLRLAHYGLKTVVLDSTTYEEANSQVKNWIRQRSRWIKGYMQTYLVYMRDPMRLLRSKHLSEFLSLQMIVGGKTAVLFINPLMWLLLAVYILCYALVGQAYRTLFPAPVLYMGTMCLVFGNFFYAYTHLFGCINRGQYGLIKWVLLIPLYWAMGSIAAFMALLQLIFKPHYWEKTQHGLHLQHTAVATAPENRQSSTPDVERIALIEAEKVLPPVAASEQQKPAPGMSEAIQSLFDLPMSMVQRRKRSHRGLLPKDSWLIATFLTACTASVVALLYFFKHNQTVVYGDAYAHLSIARRLFDNATPGFAQLGGVWLPLPHLIMVPFVWNDYLWHSGLGGSIPSMICFVIASVYLFLSARRLTKDSRASFVGTLLFILNPNILYLQTTPLSEMVLIATLTATCYHFLSWVQDDQPKQLIVLAASIFLATLARYDGWALYVALLISVVAVGAIKRHKWTRIESSVLVFATLGTLGIGLWLLWCGMIFGDPLYFQRGPFSAQAQQADLLRDHLLYTYHDLGQSVRYYALACMHVLGPVLLVLGALAVGIFLFRRRLTTDMFAALPFLVPFGFYILSLYSGQAALFLPDAVPAHAPYHLFNVRYAAEAVAPAALFLATLVSQWPKVVRFSLQITLLAVIVVQSAFIAVNGIITLQDGQFGLACSPQHETVNYLAQHYDNNRILLDTYTTKLDSLGPDAGVSFKNLIYDGSGELWNNALSHPASSAAWIIVNPKDSNDQVARHINVTSSAFLSEYTLLVREKDGTSLFRRKDLPAVPTYPVPANLLTKNRQCGADGSTPRPTR